MTIQKTKPTTGQEVRKGCRSGIINGPTAGMADGYLQTNVVILHEKHAESFENFCKLNSKACPLIEKTTPGNFCLTKSAPESDIRTDLPSYQICKKGEKAQKANNIINLWQNNLVTFLLGCSFSFEKQLVQANLPPRHISQGRNVPMYQTQIGCTTNGIFNANLVVSMRPYHLKHKTKIMKITEKYPRAHGAPLHIGSPESLGIKDLSQPDWGDPVEIRPNETPFFWACGVTSQVALENANLDFYITHTPGHMFLTDLKD